MSRFSCPYYSTLWASAAKGFKIRCYYGGRDNSIYGISSGPEHDYLPAPIDDAGIPEPLFERGNYNMVRPRTRANQNPQEPDLANVVVMLQRQLMEQQRETDRIREQIARFSQIL
uniref:Uncharacterized protein n=1 Tax=Ficus carica TaxID=3494 RepID=A0AA88EI05_FICCA|nr:hypothetical protein TIFTF001_054889 [Ficus carica]